jgi:hypothetical protein
MDAAFLDSARAKSRLLSSLFLQLILATGLAACGGSDDVHPAAPAPSTIAGPQGSSLTVPAGATANPGAIGIAVDSAGSPALPAGLAAGSVFAITPHGTAFTQPATVRIPYDPQQVQGGAQPLLLKADSAASGWAVVDGATFSGGFATATTSSLSWWVVASGSAPVITQQPQNVAVAVGDRADFTVLIVGLAPLSYQWLRDGTPIQGATTSMYSILSAAASDHGARFSVRVTNALGTVTSAEATLTVGAVTPPPPPPTSIARRSATRVAAGGGYSVAVRADGTVWYWSHFEDTIGGIQVRLPGGSNCLSTTDLLAPCRATGIANATAVAAGDRAIVVLLNDGRVQAFGIGFAGGLIPVDAPGSAPVLIANLTDIVQIGAGGEYALALRNDGQVFAWGNGNFVPTAVSGLTNVVAVDVSSGAFAVKADGTVWAWNGGREDLGLGTGFTRVTTPTLVPGLSGMGGVAAGRYNTLFWGAGSTLYNVGRGIPGTMSLPSPTPQPVTLARPVHLAAVADFYNIGTNTATPVVAIVWPSREVHGFGTLASGADGMIGFTNVVEAASGSSHILFVRSDGTVWGWGDNDGGQLGDRTRIRRTTPVQVIGLTLN